MYSIQTMNLLRCQWPNTKVFLCKTMRHCTSWPGLRYGFRDIFSGKRCYLCFPVSICHVMCLVWLRAAHHQLDTNANFWGKFAMLYQYYIQDLPEIYVRKMAKRTGLHTSSGGCLVIHVTDWWPDWWLIVFGVITAQKKAKLTEILTEQEGLCPDVACVTPIWNASSWSVDIIKQHFFALLWFKQCSAARSQKNSMFNQ